VHDDDVLTQFRTAVRRTPKAAATVYFDSVITYSELDVQSDALARWLASQGVTVGSRVCVILQNVPQAVIAFVATWKLGGIVMPCNPMYQEAELTKLLADALPSLIVCEESSRLNVDGALGQLALDIPVLTTAKTDYQTRDDPRLFGTANSLCDLRSPNRGTEPPAKVAPSGPGCVPSAFQAALQLGLGQRPPRLTGAADLALLLYTSGTTGLPKGVMLRHANLTFIAEVCRKWFVLNQQSRILGVAPLFHITGLVCQALAAFAAGCPLILSYRFHPEVMLDTIREHRPTFAIGAITAFTALMRDETASAADFNSFSSIYSGGAPIPAAVRNEFRRRFGKAIHTAFGMTETAAPTHLCPHGVEPPTDPDSGALAVGLPVDGTEAKIIGDDGAPVGPGVAGELLIRGAQVMAGYWNKPDETAVTLTDGWLHTGDVAVIDADDWCYIVDRKKDMICASGFKIWPREVEDLIYQIEAVREVVVVGTPDAYRGESVKAYVSLKDGREISADAIKQFAREKLAAYKCPREVEILPDLPKTETGKLSRAILRQHAARHPNEQQ
jgi:long-chain acyl-CoA synthetase